MAYDSAQPPAVRIYADALLADTTTPDGQLFMRLGAWDRMYEREVAWAVRAVPGRLSAHRGVQARVRQGLPLLGYYQSAAHSRSELVAAVRRARALRDDFLARRPMPQAEAA